GDDRSVRRHVDLARAAVAAGYVNRSIELDAAEGVDQQLPPRATEDRAVAAAGIDTAAPDSDVPCQDEDQAAQAVPPPGDRTQPPAERDPTAREDVDIAAATERRHVDARAVVALAAHGHVARHRDGHPPTRRNDARAALENEATGAQLEETGVVNAQA